MGDKEVAIESTIDIPGGKRCRHLLLRGIVYLGSYHFTARLFDTEGNVWFNDGRETGDVCGLDGRFEDFEPQTLNMCQGKKAVLAVYARS
jgi:hypothetical protein